MRGAWPQSSQVGTVTDRIRYLTDSINITLTKSRRMRKDEGKPGQKTADKLGWVVVRNAQPRPLTLCALLVVRRYARHQPESINFPRTKSGRVRKDEGKPGGKIARKLGRMVVRNTQAMPLTSRPAASRAPLRSLPHLHSLFRLLKNFQKTWTDKVRGI